MTKTYLSNVQHVKPLRKIERAIQNQYFVSLGGYMLELFACAQNLYEKRDTNTYITEMQTLNKKFVSTYSL